MAALSGLRYAAARALALPHVLRRYHRGHALVLCYHAVVSEEASPPRWTEVTRARFRAQMRFLRARYRILLHVGSADVGGLIEVVEWSPIGDMAWSSVTGIDQRGRWRLRAARRRYPRHLPLRLRRCRRRHLSA
jgi:hypothetical protein